MRARALELRGEQVARMFEHARASYPSECCGILLGAGSEPNAVSEVIEIPNIQDRLHAENPVEYPRDARTAYFMEPEAQMRALKDGELRGLALCGFYHSHPDHGVYFSAEDRRLAAPWGEPLFEGVAYVVIAVDAENLAGASQFVWDGSTSDYVEIPVPSPGERAQGGDVSGIERTPDRVIDTRGQSDPLALIAARDGLRLIAPDGVLEILVDDRTAAEESIPGYCEKRRYPYEVTRQDGALWKIRVHKLP